MQQHKARGQTEGNVTSPQDAMTESLLVGNKDGKGDRVKADSSHGSIFLRVGTFCELTAIIQHIDLNFILTKKMCECHLQNHSMNYINIQIR